VSRPPRRRSHPQPSQLRLLLACGAPDARARPADEAAAALTGQVSTRGRSPFPSCPAEFPAQRDAQAIRPALGAGTATQGLNHTCRRIGDSLVLACRSVHKPAAGLWQRCRRLEDVPAVVELGDGGPGVMVTR
jgi:hypothetical protein